MDLVCPIRNGHSTDDFVTAEFHGRKEGFSLAVIDTISSYYLSTYGNKQLSRYDTHKKSELRSIYNHMVKVNKESPLYKIQGMENGEASKFAIDIKEASLSLSKTALSLSDMDDISAGAFKKKVASSSNKELIKATYVGEESPERATSDGFTIEVFQMAGPQINIGHYLPENEKSIPTGQYSFDLSNSTTVYEFQFGVTESDTNIDVQEKLTRLINTANVGLNAFIDSDPEAGSSLILTSKDTGLIEGESHLFEIVPAMDSGSTKALNILGIHEEAKAAKNAVFSINGSQHSALSNNFTINKEFEITIQGITEEDRPVIIGFENDADAVYENLSRLTQSYNAALKVAHNYKDSQRHIGKLEHGLRSTADAFKNELEPAGIVVDENGYINIEENRLKEMVNSPDADELFDSLNRFKNALYRRSNQISINPMEYVNKVVVAYKNPGKNFSAPYATSLYAGMICDRKY